MKFCSILRVKWNNWEINFTCVFFALATINRYILFVHWHLATQLASFYQRCTAEVSVDRIRIGYPVGYLRFFWIRIGFGYLFLKKFGSGQDICLMSITEFSWEWFKMSLMMVAVFSLLWFLYCQYVLHSSQSMVIVLLYRNFFLAKWK